MKKAEVGFFAEGTTPHDGDDPHVYSTTIPFQQFSYLRINGANTIPEEEKKYLPQAPAPTYLNDAELHSRLFTRKDEIMKASSMVVDRETGGMRMVDDELIANQRSMFGEIISKLGKSFFSSNIIGFSLPIRFIEPRSDLDRLGELFRIFSFYLCKAANNPDRLERLKLVTVGTIAFSYLMLRKQKSINPIIGETLQASVADGSQIYCEQVSHHPPVSYIYVVGPSRSYLAYGYMAYTALFKGTFLEISMNMKLTIQFRDGHKMMCVSRPNVKVTGMLMGTRGALLKGIGRIEDLTLKLRSVTFYDYGEKKGIISTQKTVPKDWVEGIIYSPTGTAFNNTARRIADLDDVKKELARLKGSWLDKVEINSVNYWDVDKLVPEAMRYASNPLPSDWRFREDLVWLRRCKYDLADPWKDALEIRQRRDQKLRDDHAKK